MFIEVEKLWIQSRLNLILNGIIIAKQNTRDISPQALKCLLSHLFIKVRRDGRDHTHLNSIHRSLDSYLTKETTVSLLILILKSETESKKSEIHAAESKWHTNQKLWVLPALKHYISEGHELEELFR